MNPKSFLGMMSDISDEYIVSAANPHSKPIHWYQISAVAACIVLLISAAVYPKLWMQTPPVIEPPVYTETAAATTAITTTVTETVIPTETQTATTPVQTAVSSVTVTASTTVNVSVVVTETDTPTQTNTITEAEPAQTDAAVYTDSPQTDISITEAVVMTESTVTTEPQPVTIEVPLWKGIIEHLESCPEEPKPTISGRCTIFSPDADDYQREYYRETYGIPQEYDLAKHQCLLIVLNAYMYQDAAVIGGYLTNNGLHLKIACLTDAHHDNSVIHFALPIPEDLTIEPENCTIDYLILTDETEYQAMLTNSLNIKIQEQEGLQ